MDFAGEAVMMVACRVVTVEGLDAEGGRELRHRPDELHGPAPARARDQLEPVLGGELLDQSVMLVDAAVAPQLVPAEVSTLGWWAEALPCGVGTRLAGAQHQGDLEPMIVGQAIEPACARRCDETGSS